MGAGATGVVYRARDERLGRDVTLKLLPAHALGDGAARKRLQREAQTTSALNHPNICTIYDVGKAGDRLFVAMELVSGRAARSQRGPDRSSAGRRARSCAPAQIVVSSSATHQQGNEAAIFKAVIWHSILLVSLVGLIVMFYAYIAPSLIP